MEKEIRRQWSGNRLYQERALSEGNYAGVMRLSEAYKKK